MLTGMTLSVAIKPLAHKEGFYPKFLSLRIGFGHDVGIQHVIDHLPVFDGTSAQPGSRMYPAFSRTRNEAVFHSNGTANTLIRSCV